MIKKFLPWWKKTKNRETPDVTAGNIPKHVAIIMDGNGRWARRLGLPRVVGHQNGMKAVKRATIAADDLGIQFLTLYAFSTENWKRPKDEVDFLMKLPQDFLKLELQELIDKNVQVRIMGLTDKLPAHTRNAVEDAVIRTQNNTGLVLNLALNYGSRWEITESVKNIAQQVKSGELSIDDITEEHIASGLPSGHLPDPDLLIRTGAELRLSNFLLWQLAYSELFFTDIYWPEFGRDHLHEAIAEYQRRTRRFGGLT